MKKLRIIVLLLLTQCSCEKKEEMLINPYIYSLGGDTTEDGHQVFGIVGDSNADGRGTSIPTVGSGILYLWNGSTFDEITNTTVANDGSYGSIWQQFAIDYNTNTTYKVNLVNGAAGGSEFYPNGDNNNWYTSGTLYSAFTSAMSTALASKGLGRPRAIFVNLGINDIRSANTISDVTTGINSLFSRLQASYPSVPILVIQQGRTESAGQDSRAYDVKRALRDVAQNNSDVYMVGNASCFIGVSGGYNVDNLHYSQTTNNTIGSQMALWFENSAYTKWTRSVLSCFFDDPSSLRKGLIETWVESQITAGNYFDQLEAFTPFRTTTINNCNIDFAFLGYNANTDATLTANDNLALTTTQVFAFGFVPSFYTSNASYTDCIAGLKVATNSSGSGTSRQLFGRDDGTNYYRLAQGISSTNYMVNSLSTNNTATAEATYANNTLYSIASDGTNKHYIKNKTINQSNAVVPSAGVASNFRINGGAVTGFAVTVQYVYAAKYSGFDLNSFYDETEYLIAHWND